MNFKPITRGVLCLLMAGFATTSSYGQESVSGTVNAGGSGFSNDKIIVDWSIGELARIDTRYSDNKSLLLTQGFLQPDYARPLVMITDPSFEPGEVKLLPNPVKSVLKVQFSMRQSGYLRYMLFSQSGSKMQQSGFSYYGYGYTQSIDMTGYTPGVYYLYAELEPVAGSKVKKGSFKVIKFD